MSDPRVSGFYTVGQWGGQVGGDVSHLDALQREGLRAVERERPVPAGEEVAA